MFLHFAKTDVTVNLPKGKAKPNMRCADGKAGLKQRYCVSPCRDHTSVPDSLAMYYERLPVG